MAVGFLASSIMLYTCEHGSWLGMGCHVQHMPGCVYKALASCHSVLSLWSQYNNAECRLGSRPAPEEAGYTGPTCTAMDSWGVTWKRTAAVCLLLCSRLFMNSPSALSRSSTFSLLPPPVADEVAEAACVPCVRPAALPEADPGNVVAVDWLVPLPEQPRLHCKQVQIRGDADHCRSVLWLSSAVPLTACCAVCSMQSWPYLDHCSPGSQPRHPPPQGPDHMLLRCGNTLGHISVQGQTSTNAATSSILCPYLEQIGKGGPKSCHIEGSKAGYKREEAQGCTHVMQLCSTVKD
jgi:hypothetical protein